MHKTFYQFLMTQRNDDGIDEVSNFANNAFYDHTFPKQSKDYHYLTEYLELSASYLHSMDIFDDAWRLYQESEA